MKERKKERKKRKNIKRERTASKTNQGRKKGRVYQYKIHFMNRSQRREIKVWGIKK